MRYGQVDPESFIAPAKREPAHGRGAWTQTGKANHSWRYEYIDGMPMIGTNAEDSLDAWATCAGSHGYQRVLVKTGYLTFRKPKQQGVYDQETVKAVQAFQRDSTDPENGKQLTPDGTIGTSDARALLTPVIDRYEKKYGIPEHYLRGETNLESALDIGALGYQIYYPDYRGVDRAISQINNKSHPEVTWSQAFNPYFAIDWSASRMKGAYGVFKIGNPKQSDEVLWDAAICNHNNPSAATSWAKNGAPPSLAAADYVAMAKAARY